jgi:hypothetical protein
MIRVLCWNFISSNFGMLVYRFLLMVFSGQAGFMKCATPFPSIFVIIWPVFREKVVFFFLMSPVLMKLKKIKVDN